MSASAYLVFGPIAAGKSTFSKRLAQNKNAIRFTIDEWMQTLYSADRPEVMDLTWAMSRVRRCEEMILQTAIQSLKTEANVILELGTMRIDDRTRVISSLAQQGFDTQLYFVDAPQAIRKQRVQRRNVEQGETFSFEITPQMFAVVDEHFELPSAAEIARMTLINGASNHA